MKINELLTKLKKVNSRLESKYSISDHRIKALGRTTKITEELGELANEVLMSLNFQRNDKLSKFNKDNLGKELTDVLFSTILLGIELDIDIESSIKKRLKEIEARKEL